MKKLDKYILKKLLTTYFFVVLILVLIICQGVIQKIDRFFGRRNENERVDFRLCATLQLSHTPPYSFNRS